MNDGIEPQMNAIEGRNLKQLISYFKKIYATKRKAGEVSIPESESIISMWGYLLDNWGRLENFYQEKTRLRDINSNIQNIITQLRHGRNSKDKRGASFDDIERIADATIPRG
jgi:hypothetical protein